MVYTVKMSLFTCIYTHACVCDLIVGKHADLAEQLVSSRKLHQLVINTVPPLIATMVVVIHQEYRARGRIEGREIAANHAHCVWIAM